MGEKSTKPGRTKHGRADRPKELGFDELDAIAGGAGLADAQGRSGLGSEIQPSSPRTAGDMSFGALVEDGAEDGETKQGAQHEAGKPADLAAEQGASTAAPFVPGGSVLSAASSAAKKDGS